MYVVNGGGGVKENKIIAGVAYTIGYIGALTMHVGIGDIRNIWLNDDRCYRCNRRSCGTCCNESI